MQSLERKLDYQTRQINQLTQQVTNQSQLLAAILAELRAGSDEEALQAVTQQLHASAEALKRSIDANTPAERPPTGA